MTELSARGGADHRPGSVLRVRPAVILFVMNDMDREAPVADDTSTTAVDRSQQTAAAVAQAVRLLANPRRVRRA